jgi:porin
MKRWIVMALALASAGARAEDSGPQAEKPLFSADRTNLLGSMGGFRDWLDRLGITLSVTETSEVLGNATGGIHQGAEYDGLTTMTLSVDTKKAFGWEGGTFNASALQIHGRNLSADNLATLQTASGIEAERATRLWELWYDQAFGDAFDVKLGQQSADTEFMTSTGSALFLNTVMGWPALPSYDLYAGGPAYPLSSLGVRARAQPTGRITLLAGVFDDNPPGGPFEDDDQLRGAERSGAAFNLNTGALFLAEVQYALNQPVAGDTVRPGEAAGLPGTYKLGFWYDTAAFPDQRFDARGLSLADPASDGLGARHRGNWSLYGVFDQMLWRPEPKSPQSVNLFARAMGAPGDRNLITFGLNAGLTWKAPFAGRDGDTVGIGYGIVKVSGRASGLDRDTGAYFGGYAPVRSDESFVELTYSAQVAGWWSVQPDLQYVWLPGAGIADPGRPGQRVGNELVLGVRTVITF